MKPKANLPLAEMSERLSLTLLFDPATQTVRTSDGRIVEAISYEAVIRALS